MHDVHVRIERGLVCFSVFTLNTSHEKVVFLCLASLLVLRKEHMIPNCQHAFRGEKDTKQKGQHANLVGLASLSRS